MKSPQLSFLQKLSSDLIKPRRSNYSQDCLHYYLQQNKYIIQEISGIKNKYNNLLKCTIVKHKAKLFDQVRNDFNTKDNPIICIVYVHGLGSNRMEALSILGNLPQNYCLVMFDLSGSGKSQGDYTTYGYRERDDIQAVIAFFYNQINYRHFVIWGRSMGAVATLLLNNLIAEKQNQTIEQVDSQYYNSQLISLRNIYKSIKCIIADSPFCSFEQIAKDIGQKRMSIPLFLTQIGLRILQNTFNKMLQQKQVKKNFSPFQIDFQKNKFNPIVPTIFIYSLNDQVVHCDHSQKIINAVQTNKRKFIQKIIIPECGHNYKRPDNVYQAVFQKIQKHIVNDKNNKHKQSKTQLMKNQLKSVRKKSFWNFQQQFQKDCLKPEQIPQHDSPTHTNPAISSTKRTSIFTREASNQSLKSTKKRGISLSSTIQRNQQQSQSKILTITNNRGNQESQGKEQLYQFDKNKNMRKRNFSVQIGKHYNRNDNAENLYQQSPTKQIIKQNYKQIIKQNFKQTRNFISEKLEYNTKRRPSITINNLCKNRILGGKSVQKPTKPMTSTYSRPSLISEPRQSQVYYSTISHEQTPIQSSSFITIQNIESQPNLNGNREYKKSQLKTIDIMIGIDHQTRQFINKKLEGHFSQCWQNSINPISDIKQQYKQIKTQCNDFKTQMQLRKKPQQQQIIHRRQNSIHKMSLKPKLQQTYLLQKTQKSIEPQSSIKLQKYDLRSIHNDRRKKKTNQQQYLTKTIENMKITNQKYLID